MSPVSGTMPISCCGCTGVMSMTSSWHHARSVVNRCSVEQKRPGRRSEPTARPSSIADTFPPSSRERLPRDGITVYPFDRSYDWYTLPADERQALLAEYGALGSEFGSVLTNTVAGFGLGDYEWILPLESDRLTDIVDLVRTLRETRARLHLRNEVPFFTGRRIGPEGIAEVLGESASVASS